MGLKEDAKKLENKLKKIEEQSIAMELLQDIKKHNKRLFIVWIITFIAFMSLLGYTIYILNDIGTIETTNTQEIRDVNDINNSSIVNGK